MLELFSQLATAPEGMSASEFARRAGINRTTLHRIATGQTSPSLQTANELAIARGWDLTLAVSPLSDPNAAAAARVLLDPAQSAGEPPAGVVAWVTRLRRIVPDGDAVRILDEAGKAASLLHRAGAGFVRGENSARRLSSIGDATGGKWALSGAAALQLVTSGTVEGPTVLWVEDVERCMRLFADTHRTVAAPINAQIIVARADESTWVDSFSYDLQNFVAPIQLVLDGMGLGGDVERSARALAESWR